MKYEVLCSVTLEVDATNEDEARQRAVVELLTIGTFPTVIDIEATPQE